MVKPKWQACVGIALVAAIGAVVILAQACGGSAGEDVTPTATSPPAAAADGETPGSGPSFSGQAGPGAHVVFSRVGASEEFAAFLGISLDQLESEVSAEGATPASVAEAHGRTRDELKTFFIEQQQAQLSEAVAAGTMSQEDADQALETFTSRIDDIIDGNVAIGGGPGAGVTTRGGQGPFIGPSEELATFLGISLDQLESELNAEGAALASVAEAHGRTREELKTFLTEQLQTQVLEGVATGTMSLEDADRMLKDLASRIDDIMDGEMPLGGPGGAPIAPTPEGQ